MHSVLLILQITKQSGQKMSALPISQTDKSGDVLQNTKQSGQKLPCSMSFIVGTCLQIVLAYAWLEAGLQSWTDLDFHKPATCGALASGGILNLVALIGVTWQTHPWRYTMAFMSFVLQFPLYMTLVALAYPFGCTFTFYERGVNFAGPQMKEMNITQGEINHEQHIAVDCGIKICALGGLWCTNGAREFFSLLCHSIPLLYAFTFKAHIERTAAGKVHMAILAIAFVNMVDIQDFFLLLLEDDIIKNYWGRDSCEIWGCTGRYRSLWWIIMVFFWMACVLTFRSLMYVIPFDALMKGSQDRCSSRQLPVIGKGEATNQEEQQRKDEATNQEQELLCHAMASFCFLDLPFLIVRCLCSYRYGIIASTLLLKNVSGVITALILIRYNGKMSLFAKEHEFWFKMFKPVQEVFGYTSLGNEEDASTNTTDRSTLNGVRCT